MLNITTAFWKYLLYHFKKTNFKKKTNFTFFCSFSFSIFKDKGMSAREAVFESYIVKLLESMVRNCLIFMKQ